MPCCVAASRSCSHSIALRADSTRVASDCSMYTSPSVFAQSAASRGSRCVTVTSTSRLSGTGSTPTWLMKSAGGSIEDLNGSRSVSLSRATTFSPSPFERSTLNCVL